MFNLNAPKAGDRLSARWAAGIVGQLRRLYIIPGKGLKKTVTSKGTRLDLDLPAEKGGGAAVASDVVPCMVRGGTGLEGYSVDLFANGFNVASTGRGTLHVPELTTQTDLPQNSSILAHVCQATFTQSDPVAEEEPQAAEGEGE